MRGWCSNTVSKSFVVRAWEFIRREWGDFSRACMVDNGSKIRFWQDMGYGKVLYTINTLYSSSRACISHFK